LLRRAGDAVPRVHWDARVSLNGVLNHVLYNGGSVVSDVPWKAHAAVNGHSYLIDRKSGDYKHRSVQLMRQQSDQSGEPGEESINPSDFWRRSVSSWHKGAGQVYLDRKGDDPSKRARFRSSKGIDIWTQYQMSLLPTTAETLSSANTNLLMAVAGARLYGLDGAAVKYSTDGAFGSTVTSTGASAKLSIASDGFEVRFTDGADVYTTNTGTGAASVYNTLNCTLLAYVNGRWMAAQDAAIYNITSGTPPSALFTQANTDFEWVGFAEGKTAIYAAGFSGDKSLIYRIPLKPDASGLDQPIVAGVIPDGEIVRSINGYLGWITIGTDEGVRFAIADTNGALSIGALIPTPAAVLCHEGQGHYVWFGWTNYDGTSTGLGRMDPTVFGDPDRFVPAYASDLMVTGQGAVQSVVTFLGVRFFSVSGDGYYKESTSKVAEGSLDSGAMNYGITDTKVALYLDMTYGPSFAGTHTASLATDGGSTFTQVGDHADTASTNTGDSFPLNETRAIQHEVRHTLARSASDATLGPTLTSWMMRAQPAPVLATVITLPIMLFENMTTDDGTPISFDVAAEREALVALHASREVFPLQTGNTNYSTQLEDYEFRPESLSENSGEWQGVMLIQAKTT
jgi:hypothetical protein